MLEVTADSSIYISALVFAGPPLQFLHAARGGVFSLAVSDALLNEIHRVIRDKFKWSKEALDEAAANLSDFTRRVYPTRTIDAVLADPDDNRVLVCAIAAGSRFIVTGDNDLLAARLVRRDSDRQGRGFSGAGSTDGALSNNRPGPSQYPRALRPRGRWPIPAGAGGLAAGPGSGRGVYDHYRELAHRAPLRHRDRRRRRGCSRRGAIDYTSEPSRVRSSRRRPD